MATPRSTYSDYRARPAPEAYGPSSTPPQLSSHPGPARMENASRASLSQSQQLNRTVRRSVPASYVYQSQSSTAPFSVHSRGVPIHDLKRFKDVHQILHSTFRQLRDVGSSFYYLCMMQNASSLFTVLLTIISYCFFAYSTNTAKAITQGEGWTIVAFVIFMPVLGLAALGFWRRERALAAVSSVKSLTLWIYLAHRDWVSPECLPDGHLAAVQQTMFNILGELRAYLLPQRYYTSTFPYTGVRKKMMLIAQDHVRFMRRINANFKKLSQYNEPLRRAGLDTSGLCKLSDMYCQLHNAFETMANIKEYRTPLSFRTMGRFYFMLVIPIFFSPYYVYVSTAHGFNICFAILMNLAMMVLLNTSIIMEDPFDNQGLDGIYIDEPLSECEQTINMDEDHELEMAVNESLNAGIPATSMMQPLAEESSANESQFIGDIESGNVTDRSKIKDPIRSHEVNVHVEESRSVGAEDMSHIESSSMQGGNNNDSMESDKSELGLTKNFVMPPTDDDAPNYDSLVTPPDMTAVTQSTVVTLEEEIAAVANAEAAQQRVVAGSQDDESFEDVLDVSSPGDNTTV